ncbi:MAG: transporter related protein [Thermoleophilia bacterium]|nr:transporter related protein [Thermoleophilia bacterium]
MRRRPAISLLLLVAIAVVVVALVGVRRHADRSVDQSRERIDGAGVELRTTRWSTRAVSVAKPQPAVLLAHGLGDDQESVGALARTLARQGYLVRTWTSRGTEGAPGRVGVAGPREIADVRALIDELGERGDVVQDGAGDPRVAVVGISQGGGVALLAAADDHRIDAVVPIFAWSDLRAALEPNAARVGGGSPAEPGVLKVRWASELLAAGSGSSRRAAPCGNVETALCEAWGGSIERGAFTREALRLLAARSPAAVVADIEAPTLIVQGQMDSLFDLGQATELAAGLERAHVPVRVEWIRAGHDAALDRRRREHLEQAVVRWLDLHVRHRRGTQAGPRFTVELGAGRGYAHASRIPPPVRMRGLRLTPTERASADGMTHLVAPPGGLPADTTTLPGYGDLTGVDVGFDPPAGQRATFRSAPVEEGLELIGTSRIRLQVTSSSGSAILFARLVDVAPDGRRIVMRGLVAPMRLGGLPPLGERRGQGVDVALPPVAWRLAPGHRLAVDVSTTDAGYVGAPRAATYGIAMTGSAQLRVPVAREPRRTADTFEAGSDWRLLLAIAALLVAFALLGGWIAARTMRRRDERVQEPHLRDTPIRAVALTKRFRDGRLAVDGVSFAVEPGTIVGLIGPNGAGKTTIIRMLLGLVHPSGGTAHAFGQRVRPGVSRLARIGALVEGPGLAPHLSGRRHLEQYWSATGRPREAAGIDEALAVVGLTGDADRTVRTWSHGMRQRLGIAQALLGRPDLVLLDEPANGLDPAQITQLRELLRSIAADGRSVLVSSHLLGELEQVCTHVVLLAAGSVLRAGTLEQVVGDHDDLEAAYLAAFAEAEVPDA